VLVFQAPDFLISNFNPLGIKLKSKGYKLNYNNGIEGVLVFIFGSIVIKRLFRARLLGLGHEIRSLSPRDYDLHEDKDWSFCFGRTGMPSFQLSFPSLQAFQLQKKKNKKNSAYGICVVLVWDWPFSIWSLKFQKFSFKPLIF